jgi:hypothetical protein
MGPLKNSCPANEKGGLPVPLITKLKIWAFCDLMTGENFSLNLKF